MDPKLDFSTTPPDGKELLIQAIKEVSDDAAYDAQNVHVTLGNLYAAIASACVRCKGLNLGGKLAGAFSTATFVHGGTEVAILAILNQLMVFGMLIYSSGVSQGQPFIHYGPVALSADLDSYAELFRTYGRRMAEKAKELF